MSLLNTVAPEAERAQAAKTGFVKQTLIAHVSYLAQTRKSAPVILYSPECVEGAADADS